MLFPSVIPIHSSLSLSLSLCLDLSVCYISSSLKLHSVIWQLAHICTHTSICMKMLQMFAFIESSHVLWKCQAAPSGSYLSILPVWRCAAASIFSIQRDGACPCLCMNVCILTLGLLTLAWGLPANAGAVLIQVEQSHQPFGSCFQLYHLCAGLHHTHASLHCREERRAKRKKKEKIHLNTNTGVSGALY